MKTNIPEKAVGKKKYDARRCIPIEDAGRLLCPLCDTNRVQLEDSTIVLKNYKGMTGNSIFLPGHCEHGHRFSICYGNHNGFVYNWADDHDKDDRRPEFKQLAKRGAMEQGEFKL